jgi:hypothetical protein
MRFGVTSAEYAAEHHAKWYYGPRRARQLYEEARRDLTGFPKPVRSEGEKAAEE